MILATGGRNPTLLQYVIRGLAMLVVLAVLFTVLFLRYAGTFTSTVAVVANLNDVGDGLTRGADVRFNGMIVGQVSSITITSETASGGPDFRHVGIDLRPEQASGIPATVTARTVPSNLFGVNSVELVAPADSSGPRVAAGQTIPPDKSLGTLKLQDAQNQLRSLLAAVPPAQLAAVLGTIADALRGGGQTFGMFVGVLENYFDTINAQFPPGAPSGFADFNASVRGLSQSAPKLLDTLGRSVIPAMTIAENEDGLTALLSASQGVADELAALFAANGDAGKRIVTDTNRLLGAAVYEPQALPQAITALNDLAARVLTVFTGTNGHVQLNLGLSLGAFQRYTRQNCPVYDAGQYGQLRGPGCVGPGTGTGPTSSGPLRIYPSNGMRRMRPAGMVTTENDAKTLTAALNRRPNAAETLMLGPLVQAVSAAPASAPRDDGGQR